MPKKGEYSFDPPVADVEAAIKEYNGNLAAVGKKFGVGRQMLVRYLDRHPEVAVTLTDAREEMLDMAESSLYRRVLAGDAWAVCFFLKTQGRKRGYIERAETFNLNLDLNELTIEQLEKLAAGEHPSLVLGTAGGQSTAGTATADPLTIEGTSRPGAEAEDGE